MTDLSGARLVGGEDPEADFEALERERLARVVRSLLRMFMGVCAGMAVLGLALRDPWIVGVPLAILLALLVPFALLNRGHLLAATMLTALIPLAVVTVNAASGEGLRDLSIAAYGVIIVYSGLTLERRGFVWMLAAVAASLALVTLNSAYTWVPLRANTNPHWADFVVVLSIVAINAGAVWMLAKHGREGLTTAHHEIRRRRQVERELAALSAHDALTGVYSRRYFAEEVARLERTRRYPISVISADLDDLKRTNDTLGHAQGDMLLLKAAELLASVVRPDDVLARVGGDEFVILLPQTDDLAADAVVRRVRTRIDEQPLEEVPRVSLSIGCATAEADGLGGAIQIADARMYEHKAAHRAESGAARLF